MESPPGDPAPEHQPPVTLMWRETAGRAVRAVDDEVVALRLARDRLVDRGLKQIVALGGAERRAQVGGVLLAEAHVERAGAGDAHAVAAFAEIVGQRRDEAEPAAGLGDRAHSAPARRSCRGCPRASSAPRGARAPATAAGTGRCGRRRSRRAAWSRSASGPCRAPCAQRIRSSISSSLTSFSATALILIVRPAACAASMPAMTLSRSPQRVIAWNFVRVERVDRDVDALDAAVGELAGDSGRAASRWWSASARRARRCRDGARASATELHDVLAHQRLAAGQPQLADALVDEGRAEPVEFLER